MSAALTRWDGFLAQIEGRHRQVIAEVEAEARTFIASVAGGGDVAPLSRQLSAAQSRLQELEARIDDTWNSTPDDYGRGKVEAAMFAEGLGVPERDRAQAKGIATRRALEDAREELDARLYATLARQRFAHGLAARRGLFCSGCGASLEAPIVARALQVSCACGTRTPFEPGELMRSAAAMGAHAVAQEAALPQWRAMRAAQHRHHDVRPPVPLAVIKDYERSQIAYWRAYLAARAQIEPEMGIDPQKELRARMEPYYTSHAEFEEEWVRAGRPREPL